jgi:predicted O-methyltransferase YrrM
MSKNNTMSEIGDDVGSHSARWEGLLEIRDRFGPLYGTEDLCVLFYSLVRRERPRNLVELGTGLGVCSLWVAHALRELGAGHLCSFDDGSHFCQTSAVFDTMTQDVASRPDEISATPATYFNLLNAMSIELGVEEHVSFINETIDFNADFSSLFAKIPAEPIDWLFTDIAHGPAAILVILRECLPKMAHTGSIFIDSAPSYAPSRRLLEDLVSGFNEGNLPGAFADCDDRVAEAIRKAIAGRRFTLMHLREARDRRQNSTAWIKIERRDPED